MLVIILVNLLCMQVESAALSLLMPPVSPVSSALAKNVQASVPYQIEVYHINVQCILQIEKVPPGNKENITKKLKMESLLQNT